MYIKTSTSTHLASPYICFFCVPNPPRNTSDFMIPQSRNRCWMVGLRRDRFSAEDVEEVFEMVQQMKAPKTMALKKYFAHFKVGMLKFHEPWDRWVKLK